MVTQDCHYDENRFRDDCKAALAPGDRKVSHASDEREAGNRMGMRGRNIGLLSGLAMFILALGSRAALCEDAVETLVFVRHGEKPDKGLGQLNCQGLNRALALPGVLVKTFGVPTAIFAPDPGRQKADEGEIYDYVRPLATIEPTAIKLGLPIHADLGFRDIDGLQKALEVPAYRNATIFIAWEHRLIDKIAEKLLLAHGGDPKQVGVWPSNDFDSIYVVTLSWAGDTARAAFVTKKEGLDGQPQTCPP